MLIGLDPGRWYSIRVPSGNVVQAELVEFIGKTVVLREEGSILAEYWPREFLAQCEIMAIQRPIEIIEPLHKAEQRLDTLDPQPRRPNDLRAIGLWCLGGALCWGLFFLWYFTR